MEKKNKEKATVYSGGKLYIGGEYSVLIPGQSSIIKNINIFMKGELEFSETYSIYSDMYDYCVNLEQEDRNYSLIQETVRTVNKYFKLKGIKLSPFNLKITGKMEKEGKKYGIGSSGSVVVLIVKGMAKLYGYYISDEMTFKLSAYVLMKRGDNGSMGDIACIAYGSLILYTSFNRDEIRRRINSEEFMEVINSGWGYTVEKLSCPYESCELIVGWTKKPAISKDMVNKVKDSINEKFLQKSEYIIKKLKEGIKSGDRESIEKYINENGELLKSLNALIYSEELEKLVKAAKNLGICAKSSGAGGGDCGIAISFRYEGSEKLVLEWEKEGIELLYREKL